MALAGNSAPWETELKPNAVAAMTVMARNKRPTFPLPAMDLYPLRVLKLCFRPLFTRIQERTFHRLTLPSYQHVPAGKCTSA